MSTFVCPSSLPYYCVSVDIPELSFTKVKILHSNPSNSEMEVTALLSLLLKSKVVTPCFRPVPTETREVVRHACPYRLADIPSPTESKGEDSSDSSLGFVPKN